VDFSGAEDAGRRIWISSGTIEGGRLHITRTQPVCELPGGSPNLAVALDALRAFIEAESAGAVGLDFPFGLPRQVVAESTWKDFVLAFNGRYRSAEAFRDICRTLSARELRRTTDRQAHAPWAAWNWRLYRQTYYGIASILAPLVSEDRVRVLPMDSPDGTRPVLLEICPASTLRRLGLGGLPYKGEACSVKRAVREEILDRLIQRRRPLSLDPGPRERAVEDPAGDAVDSILAATAVFDTMARDPLTPESAYDPIEGFVFF
jgi:hypothetical protein